MAQPAILESPKSLEEAVCRLSSIASGVSLGSNFHRQWRGLPKTRTSEAAMVRIGEHAAVYVFQVHVSGTLPSERFFNICVYSLLGFAHTAAWCCSVAANVLLFSTPLSAAGHGLVADRVSVCLSFKNDVCIWSSGFREAHNIPANL